MNSKRDYSFNMEFFHRRWRSAMSESEIVLYTSNKVYGRLGVSGSTLRKYSDVLEREGYEVRKDSRGRREYTEFDVVLIEQLVELSKHKGMTLEKAAKMITKQFGIHNKQEESQDQIQFLIKCSINSNNNIAL